jgi:hypothetical protein
MNRTKAGTSKAWGQGEPGQEEELEMMLSIAIFALRQMSSFGKQESRYYPLPLSGWGLLAAELLSDILWIWNADPQQ